MLEVIRPAFMFLLVMTLLTGIVYPLAITGVAQLAFSHQANGSLLYDGDKAIGSELIGQPFDDPKYFWSRPSATSPYPYNASASSGSNLGPIEPYLVAALQSRVDALKAADPTNSLSIPMDLITSSASGLDPHISTSAAEYQTQRVARVRDLSNEAVQRLITQHTEPRSLGFLGEVRVNVLTLNLALDKMTQ